ncbi:sensor histidine kinase [Sulfurospirillum arcachonense]|uniref:sensor histidine kinase n=1 Tax=Sulfurospirillum arcachonense TaxID=57666 RepID=UPI00046835AD|nr:sensor histidine kinase [Sulfurospirillum arcachonense]
MKYPSIKIRLIKWLIYSLIFILIITFSLIFFYLEYKINQYFDNVLMHESSSIIERLYVQDSKVKFKQPNMGIHMQTSAGESSVFYSVEDSTHNLLAGFDDIPKPNLTQNTPAYMYYNTIFLGKKIRSLYIKHQMLRNGNTYVAFVYLAETLEDRNAIIKEVLIVISTIIFIIMIIAIFSSLFAVKKGIEPLINLQYSIKRRDINDLTPIKEVKIPIEVISLVKSINQLLIKLKKSFSHIERFNADISHQLRTPLAELKMLTEMDESIENIPYKKRNLTLISSMINITQQLLLYAKTNPDTFNRVHFKAINFTLFCENIAKDKISFIYNRGFKFVFDAKDEIWIFGGPIILESMLNNLIDNALNYAVDKKDNPQGTITLALTQTKDTVILCIKDEGPGIPEKYLDSIYERFFRLDSNKQGSGLGLSIVKQIVELHNARISIKNESPQGLSISIFFKRYTPEKTMA